MEVEVINNKYYKGKDSLKGEINTLDESALFIESFDDYKPLPNKEYFKGRVECPEKFKHQTLITGMVFYNEDVYEVRRTLNSIGVQINQVRNACKSQVIVVGDGIKQMHESTANYLKELFCSSTSDLESWDNMMNDLSNSKNKTYVLQRKTLNTNSICCIKVNHCQYPMTLVLKSENRRKHNSQEWILNGFATQAFDKFENHSHFVLLTDCGTLFDSNCFYRLLRYMVKHPKCVGTTGRQRVMTAKEQDMEDEGWFSMAKYFRIVQLADYEVSYATYTGAFSAAGCLPVLPGPCAMFRFSGLLSERYNTNDIEEGNQKESALQHYNNIVNIPINQTNICVENVKLAEDRIPSYSVITHGQEGAYTTWVDGAVFKFQAETSMRQFILQRRRWINGALSCYVWNCLVHPGLILKSRQNIFRKMIILLLYWLQFLNYIFAMCTYGVMAGSLYISLLSIFNLDSKMALLVIFIYGSMVVNHLIVHKFHVYSPVLTYIVMFINAAVLGMIVSGFVYEIIRWGDISLIHQDIGHAMIIYSAIAMISIPFLMAIISLNVKSIFYVLFSFLPYFLFLPTLVGTFVMYSIARLSDITWGNRVSTAQSSFEGATKKEVENLKNNFNIISGFVLLSVICLNVGVCVVIILFYKNSLVIGSIIVAIAGVFIIQCMISIFYFLVKHIGCQTCVQRYV